MVAVSLTQSHLRLLSDERLARLVGLGSGAAFAVLYGRHRRDLERYARALARDGHDADDGLQSAMLKAYGALREDRRDAPVRPWLFRIVHNEAMSVHRRRATAPSPREPELLATSPAADVHDHVAAREELRGVIAGLDLLTAHQRSALLMRRLGGLGYDEIALVLGTTPVAARQAVSTARKRLAESQSRPRLARLAGLLPLGPLSAILRFFSEAATIAPSSGGGRAVAAAAVAVVAGVGAADVADRVHRPTPERRATTVASLAPVPAATPAPKAVLASATTTASPASPTTAESDGAAATRAAACGRAAVQRAAERGRSDAADGATACGRPGAAERAARSDRDRSAARFRGRDTAVGFAHRGRDRRFAGQERSGAERGSERAGADGFADRDRAERPGPGGFPDDERDGADRLAVADRSGPGGFPDDERDAADRFAVADRSGANRDASRDGPADDASRFAGHESVPAGVAPGPAPSPEAASSTPAAPQPSPSGP
jgi:RNA polymerase sigma factor (sigma-70 family)